MGLLKYILLVLFVCLILFSCSSTEEPEIKGFEREVELSGVVQKGPFQVGTSVDIDELNEDLTPTGLTYSAQIENNAGLFQLPSIEYSSQYIELQAEGYFFNEVQNQSSSAPITLYGISDISDRNTINVNMLSTLERPRIKTLISEGISYEAAKRTAYNEIMNIFNMPEDTTGQSEDLDISQAGDENAKLLAISLMLLGNRSEADLSELISNISFDIQEDGILNSSSSREKIFSSVEHLDLEGIRQNLVNRFDALGISSTISSFEEFLPDTLSILSSITVEDFTNNTLGSIDVTVYGGTPPYSFLWSTNAETEDLSNIQSGEYFLTVMDANSYSKIFAFQVGGILKDIDNNVYHAMRIGDQVWMAENLKVTRYRNGESIPTGYSDDDWAQLTIGSYTAQANDDNNVDTYGYLYNWYAVNDIRNIAPNGWRVPTDGDWQVLIDYLGGSSVAGDKLKEAGTEHWGSPSTNATNGSGFTALPGGYRTDYSGESVGLGSIGSFWSSADLDGDRTSYIELNSNYPGAYQLDDVRRNGFSIRCILNQKKANKRLQLTFHTAGLSKMKRENTKNRANLWLNKCS